MSFKSQTIKGIIVLCLPIGILQCKEKNDPNKVVIVSTDKQGNEKVFRAPQALFQGIFRNVAERTERSVLKSLNKDEENPDFDLTRVSVGLKIEAEGGIRPGIEIGGEAAFELRYEHLPLPNPGKNTASSHTLLETSTL